MAEAFYIDAAPEGVTVIRGAPEGEPQKEDARCYDTSKLHEVRPEDADLVRAAIDALLDISAYAYGFSPYYSVRRVCVWRTRAFPAYAGIGYSSALAGYVLHLREDAGLLARERGLRPAFNFTMLHEVYHTKYGSRYLREFVESAIATGAAAGVPRKVLEQFAEVIMDGIVNEHIFAAYEVAERDPETLAARRIVGEGILPHPGAVWIIPHPELRKISQRYTSRYPELARGSHAPYWTYAETCLHKAVAWGLPGYRYPQSANDVVYALTWEHALSAILKRMEHSSKVLRERRAGEPGVREYLVWYFTVICGLHRDVAEKLADELVKRNAVVFKVVEHTLRWPDPQGGEPCTMRFVFTHHVPCPAGRCKEEEKCACAEGDTCTCTDAEDCAGQDRVEIDIDPRRVVDAALPPGAHYTPPIVLDFRVRRLRVEVPPIGGELFETRGEEGKPRWVQR